MAVVKAPRSLRSFDRANLVKEVFDARTGRKVTVGCMIAVASFTAAEAQELVAAAGNGGCAGRAQEAPGV